MLRFHKWYFLLVFLLFLVEVYIALFLHDRIIRPYGGDFLVVMLIYCFVKSFWEVSTLKLAILVLLFAYTVEVSQYFHLVNRLGLGSSKFARVVMGTTFQWIDLVSYTLGILGVIGTEKLRSSKPQRRLRTS